jgi:hypothetical protein
MALSPAHRRSALFYFECPRVSSNRKRAQGGCGTSGFSRFTPVLLLHHCQQYLLTQEEEWTEYQPEAHVPGDNPGIEYDRQPYHDIKDGHCHSEPLGISPLPSFAVFGLLHQQAVDQWLTFSDGFHGCGVSAVNGLGITDVKWQGLNEIP